MSKNIAILDDNGLVLNIIISNDDEVETVNKVAYSDSTAVYIGGHYIDGIFYSPSPFPSWIRGNGEWLPPVERPSEGQWYWDEDLGEWHEAEAL
jgi:hypothetical protein